MPPVGKGGGELGDCEIGNVCATTHAHSCGSAASVGNQALSSLLLESRLFLTLSAENSVWIQNRIGKGREKAPSFGSLKTT